MTRMLLVTVAAAGLVAGAAAAATRSDGDPPPDVLDFLRLAAVEESDARDAMERITAVWRDDYAAMIVDLARLFRPPGATHRGDDVEPGAGGPIGRRSDGDDIGLPAAGAAVRRDPGSPVRARLVRFLEERTGRAFGHDLDAWRRWLWSRTYAPHPDYAAFKGGVLSRVDPRFAELLPAGAKAEIRLDQVDWGGVRPDGIPALDHPKVEPAAAARWLRDKHVVFGLVVDGEARAYPKRIVAWHEMVRDRIAGRDLVLAYCTLCGAAIPYDVRVGERSFTFGTSGLLYRSNKLMYDAETGSLWSALTGRPVIGPLAGSDVRLARIPVVTTTWGEWRAAHPGTTVVSIDTGFERDYREGAAYRDYFASPDPMFAVPVDDDRLAPKDEVVIVPADPQAGDAAPPIAIDLRRLARDPVLVVRRDRSAVVVVRSARGAARAYDAGDERFRASADGGVTDAAGRPWRADEDALRPVGHAAEPRRRIPAHRAFWFGAVAQWPGLELIR